MNWLRRRLTVLELLITDYCDDAMYRASEENFQGIIKRVAPGEPKLLHGLGRKEFILGVKGYAGKTMARRP
jgi:hypothetical protein